MGCSKNYFSNKFDFVGADEIPENFDFRTPLKVS